MAKNRIISAAVLNIANEKEKPQTYLSLFQDAYDLKKPIKVRGTEFIILTSIEVKKSDSEIFGTFARFTEIDMDLPWFNIESLREARETEKNQITIPDSLRPNMSSFFYKFDARTHKFFFESRSIAARISPYQVARFVELLLSDSFLLEKYGTTNVTLISSFESFEKAIALFRLKRLIIKINKPNPDDLGDIEKKVRNRLKKQNAQTLVDELVAEKGKSLKPDKETRQLGRVAALNGEVQAEGKNEDGTPAENSTLKHPIVESEKYDVDLVSDAQAFNRTIEKIRQRLRLRNAPQG